MRAADCVVRLTSMRQHGSLPSRERERELNTEDKREARGVEVVQNSRWLRHQENKRKKGGKREKKKKKIQYPPRVTAAAHPKPDMP
jgi:hypothetical protein